MDPIITLLQEYITGLLDAEDNFIDHLDSLTELEETVVELSNHMAAGFLGVCLTTADELIRESSSRKKDYIIQRNRFRTLISSVGDVTFSHTVFEDKEGHSRQLLDEAVRLPQKEKFTAVAEAKLLNEAEAYSYQHAADSISSGGQKITKTTVMNKVHAFAREIPDFQPVPEQLQQVEYLYIEADEDHISNANEEEKSGCHIGKLVYLFEGKVDVCKGRRMLVNPVYFGGIYNGTDNNRALWKSVQDYIDRHYDPECLKCVYISGDGARWIRAATDYIDQSVFVADRFHLKEYIYRAAGCAREERDDIVGQLYECIYNDNLKAARRVLNYVKRHYSGGDTVDACRKFMNNHWDAIQVAFHDENVQGCSAEGHVSNVFSVRMSSRPMAWSSEGADGMCKLRCFVKNSGRDKVIDLVCWRRQHELGELAATGTDGGLISSEARAHYTASQRQARSYIERIQATLMIGSTARKTIAISERIGMI